MKSKFVRIFMVVSLLLGSVGMGNISVAQENEVEISEFDQSDLKIDPLEDLEFQTEETSFEEPLDVVDVDGEDSTILEDLDGIESIAGDNRYIEGISDINPNDPEWELLDFGTNWHVKKGTVYGRTRHLLWIFGGTWGGGSPKPTEWENYNFGYIVIDESRAKTRLSGDFKEYFQAFPGLLSIKVEGVSLQEVTSFQAAFGGLKLLQSVVFRDNYVDTRHNLTRMNNMFVGCPKLVEVDLSGIPTDKVVYMGSVFWNCPLLKEVKFGDQNYESLSYVSTMFSGCTSLEEIELDFRGSSSLLMSTMFSNCTALKKVTITNATPRDTVQMFQGCSSLEEVNLAYSGTTPIAAASYMFDGCSSLKKINISEFNTSEIQFLANMFRGCSSLEELDLSDFGKSAVLKDDGNNMFEGTTALSSLILGEGFNITSGLDFSNNNLWLDEKKGNVFTDASQMSSFHADLKEINTYRKGKFETLTMNAMGGKFEDSSELKMQHKLSGVEYWDEIVPTNEGYSLEGWYLDEEYTREFDFSQLATESVTIFAKWLASYTVTIPATINLNSEEKMSISGINNGSGTLKVNLKGTESQINDFNQLRLTHKQNADVTAHTTLSWEQLSSDIWNVLTIEPEASSVSKSADIGLTKPENMQAGDYEGQMVFSIRYE